MRIHTIKYNISLTLYSYSTYPNRAHLNGFITLLKVHLSWNWNEPFNARLRYNELRASGEDGTRLVEEPPTPNPNRFECPAVENIFPALAPKNTCPLLTHGAMRRETDWRFKIKQEFCRWTEVYWRENQDQSWMERIIRKRSLFQERAWFRTFKSNHHQRWHHCSGRSWGQDPL